MKQTSFVSGLVLIVATICLVASCKDQSSDPYGTTPTPTPANAPNTVVMAGIAFSPNRVSVAKGTTLTWLNRDAYATHTATSDSSLWDTGNILPGGSKAVTFTTAGTYTYHCLYHGAMGMTGTVVVQ